ncbi:MAG: YfhO family protein, partial [Chitinophagaceae bacterium]|nr:YfhO family protein [Chitinophagaceae bacterium]
GRLIQAARSHELTAFLKASGIALGAGLIGILANAVMLFTTYDYSKATIRGGQASLKIGADSLSNVKTNGGLDTAYAFLYGSYGVAESFTLLVPDMYGGGSNPLGEESKLVQTMQEKGLPQQLASQLYSYFPGYWGNQPGHAGPVYLGALFVLLFIFGMFHLRTPHKWWILALTAFSLFMSWGKNFGTFNNLMFEYLPFYNKFRAPAMILVIPQLLFPMVSVMVLQRLFASGAQKEEAWKSLRLTGIFLAGCFVLLGAMYMSFDYLQGYERSLQQQLSQLNPQDPGLGRDIIDAVVADRKGKFGGDLVRSLAIVGMGWLLLFLFIRNKVAQGEGAFAPTQADQIIKQDPDPNYRVLNLTQSTFNDAITSYHHKSVGGYHAAKLSIYQDLIENQLSKQPMNMSVLNMLNTRYVITQDSSGQVMPSRNPGALGNVWFVQEVRFVKDPAAEMKALDDFDPARTAVVQEAFRSSVTVPATDSGAVISLVKNDHDIVTYQSVSSAPQFAVFSEVYYDRGWKAFVDGKESPIVKANYVLRGLSVPAGKHAIEFRFEPSSYANGRRVTAISQFVLIGLLLGALLTELRRNRQSA